MRKETVDWEKAKCLYRQGYSYKEISKIMGVSVQTLKNSY
ncbi:MAG: helix-turn-helix domain-containing protein [Clostridiales bacterium]|nr:helix-turn-helix domain-containing protein [Clostridiales bacterium]